MENNIIYSNNVDSDVEIIEIIDNCKKLVDLPIKKLKNVINIDKFEELNKNANILSNLT